MITEIKYTVNVTRLNHPETTPHLQSVEKLSSRNLKRHDIHEVTNKTETGSQS